MRTFINIFLLYFLIISFSVQAFPIPNNNKITYEIVRKNKVIGLHEIFFNENNGNLNIETKIEINRIKDYRNYKVSYSKAKNILGYRPAWNINDIVYELVKHLDKFKDFDNDLYYNIEAFKAQDDQNNEK